MAKDFAIAFVTPRRFFAAGIVRAGALVTVPADGKTTVLDFWAPSSKPCREVLAALVAKKGEIEARGARLVFVALLAPGLGRPAEVCGKRCGAPDSVMAESFPAL